MRGEHETKNRQRKTPAAQFFIFLFKKIVEKVDIVNCCFNLHLTYINRASYKEKKLVDIVWVGALVDNDRDPSKAHPPTEDHP